MFQLHLKKNKGFTVLEILITLSLIVLISVFSFGWLQDVIKKERLNKEVKVLVAFLTEARSKTLSAKEASHYGVRTETNQIILFKGSTYSPSDPLNRVHDMDSTVIVSMGAGETVVFEKLTGNVTSVGDSLLINLSTSDYERNESITVYRSGLIEKN